MTIIAILKENDRIGMMRNFLDNSCRLNIKYSKDS